MAEYPDIITRLLLQPDLMSHLNPTEPLNREILEKVRKVEDKDLTDGKPAKSALMLNLVKAALLYGADAIDEAHKIFQDDTSDLAAYWHGMIHRREGDFDNARYWFRRAGTLPIFSSLHMGIADVSPTMARQVSWDAYLFTGQCEQVKFGDAELKNECAALQRVEFEKLLDYTWRQAVG